MPVEDTDKPRKKPATKRMPSHHVAHYSTYAIGVVSFQLDILLFNDIVGVRIEINVLVHTKADRELETDGHSGQTRAHADRKANLVLWKPKTSH